MPQNKLSMYRWRKHKDVVWAGLLFLIGGLTTIALTAVDVRTGLENQYWPSTPGQMLSARLLGGYGRTPYHITVEYVYEVDGYRYRGHVIGYGGFHLVWNSDEAQRRVAGWRAKTWVPVFYDPAEPERAVLISGVDEGIFIYFIVGGVAAVLGILFFFVKEAPS
ncbi:DUF3592 domain-containing protein [Nitrosococcus wardiae]|uniref:DUF3592 domain-containing protein n=1 Tax=Nitrosococcus wardiae TaxID=1814290 RepID=A0A4P7C2N0_9GAMM|nr:DUF3592 domain-containing protein [Nitrosococcus wardiae]QBQ55774.1 DUF3592 domain-containing protein [Nitrosococcus wardiae]